MDKASDIIRDRLSMRTRREIAERRVRLRIPTSRHRVIPDFLIIGAQRSGTSSLYRYLGSHPEVIPSLRKETQYFSRRFGEGPLWYRAHFPLATRVRLQSVLRQREVKTFEATPDYLFHPLAAERVKSALPEARFIVMLRDPVERTFSHYNHMLRLGFETLPFEQALEAEDERVSADLDELTKNEMHQCVSALRFSYVRRSLYAEQLGRWFHKFPTDRFLLIDAHDFFADEGEVLARVCRFIGVDDWAPESFRNYSRPPRSDPGDTSITGMETATRARLAELYAPEDEKLAEMTGRSFSWMSERET